MTTLAEDSDSWRASGLMLRDFRHTHDGPEVPRHRSKPKHGKRWCRGKVGRAHNLVRVIGRYGYDVDTCTVCGRKVAWHWKGFRYAH